MLVISGLINSSPVCPTNIELLIDLPWSCLTNYSICLFPHGFFLQTVSNMGAQLLDSAKLILDMLTGMGWEDVR